MSTSPTERDRPVEAVAGLMAATALFASVFALVAVPVRIGPPALVVALVAAGIGGRHARLAGAAVAVAGICFVLGLAIAAGTDRPLW